jgi:hypothetical protein
MTQMTEKVPHGLRAEGTETEIGYEPVVGLSLLVFSFPGTPTPVLRAWPPTHVVALIINLGSSSSTQHSSSFFWNS